MRPVARRQAGLEGRLLSRGLARPGKRGHGRAERRTEAGTTRETSYYLSSLDGDVQAFAQAVRGHWGIENRQHWVLDIAFREDDSRIRMGHASQNFALLRRIALNLLQHERSVKAGTKAKHLRASWDAAYLLKVLHG